MQTASVAFSNFINCRIARRIIRNFLKLEYQTVVVFISLVRAEGQNTLLVKPIQVGTGFKTKMVIGHYFSNAF